jgi:hypothetical protein
LAFHLISDSASCGDIYVLSNQANAQRRFQLPSPSHKKRWFLKCNTAAAQPEDIFDDENIRPIKNTEIFIAEGHATVILESR